MELKWFPGSLSTSPRCDMEMKLTFGALGCVYSKEVNLNGASLFFSCFCITLPFDCSQAHLQRLSTQSHRSQPTLTPRPQIQASHRCQGNHFHSVSTSETWAQQTPPPICHYSYPQPLPFLYFSAFQDKKKSHPPPSPLLHPPTLFGTSDLVPSHSHCHSTFSDIHTHASALTGECICLQPHRKS